jgi:hypothetical protein
MCRCRAAGLCEDKDFSQVLGMWVDGRRVIGLLAAVRFSISSRCGLVRLRVWVVDMCSSQGGWRVCRLGCW